MTRPWVYIPLQNLKLPSTAIFASAYGIYGGKLNKKRLMPFTRRRNVVELESIDCFCATLESGALFMVSD